MDIIMTLKEKKKIIEIVSKICDTESTNCRSLNKVYLARELMNIANIPTNADICEIPLDWNNQVVVLFLIPEDDNYYSLFAGIGKDRKFYFELSVTGKLLPNRKFYFYSEIGKEDVVIPIDYFKRIGSLK